MKVILIKNAVETLGYFSEQLAETFQEMGHDTYFVDYDDLVNTVDGISRFAVPEKTVLCTFNFIGLSGEEVFIGREWVQNKNFSEDTARLVDSEVKRIVEEAHARCRKLLQDNEETLHRIARALLDRETITGDDLDLLMENKELPPLDINGKPLKSSRPGGPQNRDKGGDFVLEPDDAGQETSGDAATADAMGQTPPATPETDPSRPEPATTPTPEQADHAGQADLKDPADHAEQDKK